jgi:transcriptional regulator with XRE-family HTH domain
MSRLREKFAQIPPGVREQVRMQREVGNRVEQLMNDRTWTRTELARRLGKEKSVVTHIIAGDFNLTLRTIGELEAVFGERIIVPQTAVQKVTVVIDDKITNDGYLLEAIKVNSADYISQAPNRVHAATRSIAQASNEYAS